MRKCLQQNFLQISLGANVIFPAISQQFSLAYFPGKFTSKFLDNPCKFPGNLSKFLANGKSYQANFPGKIPGKLHHKFPDKGKFPSKSPEIFFDKFPQQIHRQSSLSFFLANLWANSPPNPPWQMQIFPSNLRSKSPGQFLSKFLGGKPGNLTGNLEIWRETWKFGGKPGNLAGNLEIWQETWKFGGKPGNLTGNLEI